MSQLLTNARTESELDCAPATTGEVDHVLSLSLYRGLGGWLTGGWRLANSDLTVG